MVEKRLRLGDGELDTTIRRKHCPDRVRLVERKSQLSLIAYLAKKALRESNKTSSICALLVKGTQAHFRQGERACG